MASSAKQDVARRSDGSPAPSLASSRGFSGLHSAEAPYYSSERMHEAEGEDATVTPQRVPV